ncbi:hypothetical protein [Roseibacillus persicicus]|nr:hypothetical protein [Roseibacillus persicicus]
MSQPSRIKDSAREGRLRRAMLQVAQGIPAEGERWMRFRSVVRFLIWTPFVLLFGGLLLALGPQNFWMVNPVLGELRILSFGVLIAGILILWVGSRLLLPRDGATLLFTPVSEDLVWRHSFRAFRYVVLGLWLLGTWIFVSGDLGWFQSAQMSAGWLLIPLAGVCWQLQNRGRAGKSVLLWGIVLLVLSFVFPLADFSLPEIELEEVLGFDALIPFLPSAWPQLGVFYYLFLAAAYGFTVWAWWRTRTHFRFRQTQVARVLLTARPPDEDVVETTNSPPLPLEKSAPRTHAFFARIFNEKERDLAETLDLRWPASFFLSPLLWFLALTALAVGLLSSGWVLQDIVPWFEPSKMIEGIESGSLWWVVYILLFVFPAADWSRVALVAFHKFSAGGPRQVALLGVFPVSERRLYTMLWKEWLLLRSLKFPALIALLFVLKIALELSWDGVFASLLGMGYLIYLFVGPWVKWTMSLWQSLELFPKDPVGEAKKFWSHLFYWGPLALFAFATVAMSEKFLDGRTHLAWVILPALSLLVWAAGSCWWVRRLYNQSRGSLITLPQEKKSFSFSKR